MPKQLDLCDPYLANQASYEILAMTGAQLRRAQTLKDSNFDATAFVDRTSEYLSAVDTARTHCLMTGCEVWVVDRNDGDSIVFRVGPEEYSARELRTRNYQSRTFSTTA